ncbi:MAG: hypothetical protein R3E08_04465 [Thiotrichaceae bacterium]
MKRLEIERKILQCIHQMQEQILPEVLQYLERLNSQDIPTSRKRFEHLASYNRLSLWIRDELV